MHADNSLRPRSVRVTSSAIAPDPCAVSACIYCNQASMMAMKLIRRGGEVPQYGHAIKGGARRASRGPQKPSFRTYHACSIKDVAEKFSKLSDAGSISRSSLLKILAIPVGLLPATTNFGSGASLSVQRDSILMVGGPSGYETIGEAIAAAREISGSKVVIQVSSGTYKERLTIDTPLTLEAFPKGSEVEVKWETTEPYQSVVTSTARDVKLKGLKIRHASPSVADNYAVHLISSDCKIQDCDISSATGSGVGVEGGHVYLTCCTISHCRTNGLFLYPLMDLYSSVPDDVAGEVRSKRELLLPYYASFLGNRPPNQAVRARPAISPGSSSATEIETAGKWQAVGNASELPTSQPWVPEEAARIWADLERMCEDWSVPMGTGEPVTEALEGPPPEQEMPVRWPAPGSPPWVVVAFCMISDNRADGILAGSDTTVLLNGNTVTSNGGWGLNTNADIPLAAMNDIVANGKGALQSRGACPAPLLPGGTAGTGTASGNRLRGRIVCRQGPPG
eukprot:jgi/Botrbrau1/3860/Bobra.0183s0085.1